MTSEISSQPPNAWDFTKALDLLAAFKLPPSQRIDEPPRTPPSPSPLYQAHLYDPKARKSKALGDFDRLLEFIGKPLADSSSSEQESIESSFSTSSDKSTPPSSLPENATHIEDFIGKGKEVRWTDEVDEINIAEFRRQRTRSSNFGLDPALKITLGDSEIENSTPSRSSRSRRKSRAPHNQPVHSGESESEAESRVVKPRSKRRIRVHDTSDDERTPSQNNPTITNLIPSLVNPNRRLKSTHSLWVPPPVSKTAFDSTLIRPLYTLTREEKYAKLVKKLQQTFSSESDALTKMKANQVMEEYGGNNSPDGLHVFVDCSNIVIGFVNDLKRRRGMNLDTPAKGGIISWHALALVLERGRRVARRVLVGSHGSPLYDKQPKRPDFMVEAERCGYEVNILDRVVKHKEPTPTRKRRGNGNGYATTSGYSSGSDGTYMTRMVTEQAVDEILHMKLLESLIDTKEPSTIVLASGDAAEAEYSGGFLKNVERALSKGWKVEIVSWSAGLSQDYQSKGFLRRWKRQFSIITLDVFSEELLAMYTNTIKAPEGVEE
jgi:hypothetical protein